MWSSSYLKNRAKEVLRSTYWYSFVVCLIFTVCGGGVSPVTCFSGSLNEALSEYLEQFSDINELISVMTMLVAVFSIGYLLAIAFRILVCNPVEIGKNKFFIQSAYGESKIEYVVHSFKNNYKNGVKIIFLRNLFVNLWLILLMIPGIVKKYEYFCVPYILAENPDIEYARVFEMSKKMTYDKKWDIFMLDISFLGWYLLGFALCGLGVLFVNPYASATKAQLYLELKSDALSRGIVTDSDFAHYITY